MSLPVGMLCYVTGKYTGKGRKSDLKLDQTLDDEREEVIKERGRDGG